MYYVKHFGSKVVWSKKIYAEPSETRGSQPLLPPPVL